MIDYLTAYILIGTALGVFGVFAMRQNLGGISESLSSHERSMLEDPRIVGIFVCFFAFVGTPLVAYCLLDAVTKIRIRVERK